MKKVLCIITARGGSKRIPRKNIKDFLGKPIIAYSIEAAVDSNIFTEVMVSTDDAEIAEIAITFGANIPFLRSTEASNDYATTATVIEEVLLQFKSLGNEFDYACCIYPTAPFVTAEKLIKAYEMLCNNNYADSLIPVVRFSFPILRSLKMQDGYIRLNWPEYLNARSQDLPPAYHDAGQFYFFSVKDFLKTKKLFTDSTIPFEMLESEVQDIDNEEDWKIAEIKYTFLKNINS